MGTGLALLAILVMVSYLVIWPLAARNHGGQRRGKDGLSLETGDEVLERDKEAVFTTINEIEFDYQMKKLSENDYSQLKEHYKQKALEILQEEDDNELAADTVPRPKKGRVPSGAERAGKESAATPEISEVEDEIEKELAALRLKRS